MSVEEQCTCNPSWTCPMHQRLIDAELERDNNQKHAERVDERLDWVVKSLKAIAEKMNIELPEEP